MFQKPEGFFRLGAACLRKSLVESQENHNIWPDRKMSVEENFIKSSYLTQ